MFRQGVNKLSPTYSRASRTASAGDTSKLRSKGSVGQSRADQRNDAEHSKPSGANDINVNDNNDDGFGIDATNQSPRYMNMEEKNNEHGQQQHQMAFDEPAIVASPPMDVGTVSVEMTNV
jgi:hypothetical protein